MDPIAPRALLALALGLVVGLAVGWAARGAPTASPEDPATPLGAGPCPPIRTAPAVGSAPPPPTEPAGACAELPALRAQVAVLTGQLAAYGGVPVDGWPADLAPVLRPGAFEARLRRDPVPGLTVEEVDCSEFPCLARIAVDAALPAGTAAVWPLTDGIAEDARAAGPPVSLSSALACHQDAGCSALVWFGPPDPDPELEARIQVRVKSLQD